MYTLYKITNSINNKVYIGQTNRTLKSRFIRHCNKNSGCKYLLSAILLYGKENFKIESISERIETQDEADFFEKFWIKIFDSNNKIYGYNLTSGGRDGISSGHLGKKHSDSAKEKIRLAHIDMKPTDETRKILSEKAKNRPSPMKGRKWSEESKIKRTEAHRILNPNWGIVYRKSRNKFEVVVNGKYKGRASTLEEAKIIRVQ